MEKARSYKDLVVWQTSLQFSVEVYRITQAFPKAEIHGLTNQLRRAAVSIPSNIAEGYAYRSDSYLKRYLDIALGSAAEVDTQLRIALQVNYLAQAEHDGLQQELEEIVKMLHGLRRSLNMTTHT